jgi:hypothetical protein
LPEGQSLFDSPPVLLTIHMTREYPYLSYDLKPCRSQLSVQACSTDLC